MLRTVPGNLFLVCDWHLCNSTVLAGYSVLPGWFWRDVSLLQRHLSSKYADNLSPMFVTFFSIYLQPSAATC